MKNTNTKLKVAITSDHAGFDLKQKIRLNLENSCSWYIRFRA